MKSAKCDAIHLLPCCPMKECMARKLIACDMSLYSIRMIEYISKCALIVGTNPGSGDVVRWRSVQSK